MSKSQKYLVGQVFVFVAAFGLTFILTVQGIRYVQQRSYTASADTLTFVDPIKNTENPVAQDINDPVVLDMYAKHLTSINDPNKGCGCPACCGAI